MACAMCCWPWANGVESRFYCDPADGTLVSMEMYPDDESDPCEVYFSDYRLEATARFLPHRMEVHSGDSLFGVFVLTGFDGQTEPNKSSDKAADEITRDGPHP